MQMNDDGHHNIVIQEKDNKITSVIYETNY